MNCSRLFLLTAFHWLLGDHSPVKQKDFLRSCISCILAVFLAKANSVALILSRSSSSAAHLQIDEWSLKTPFLKTSSVSLPEFFASRSSVMRSRTEVHGFIRYNRIPLGSRNVRNAPKNWARSAAAWSDVFFDVLEGESREHKNVC